MHKFTEKELFQLIDTAKKDWQTLSNPLEGMKRNFDASEILAMSYFLAALTVLNSLTGQRISDMVDIKFSQIDVSSHNE